MKIIMAIGNIELQINQEFTFSKNDLNDLVDNTAEQLIVLFREASSNDENQEIDLHDVLETIRAKRRKLDFSDQYILDELIEQIKGAE